MKRRGFLKNMRLAFYSPLAFLVIDNISDSEPNKTLSRICDYRPLEGDIIENSNYFGYTALFDMDVKSTIDKFIDCERKTVTENACFSKKIKFKTK